MQHLETISRRRFLRCLALAGLGAAAAGLPVPVSALAQTSQGRALTRTYLAMGTFVTLTVVHPSQTLAEEAMGRAMAEVDRLEALLSRFAPASALSVLNDQGRLAGPPPELAELALLSRRMHGLTNQAFDPTILPVLLLVSGRVTLDGDLDVSGLDLAEALARTGMDGLGQDERGLCLRPGMGLTLDGIAKGFIVDQAARALARCGAENFLVNAGGDIRAQGRPEFGRAWTIAVQDPLDRDGQKAVISLSQGALATSGGYEVAYGRQRLYHHIIDPRTGASPHGTAGASVAAPTAVEADALATAAMVMRPRAALAMLRCLPGRECLLVAADGARLPSPGWPPGA